MSRQLEAVLRHLQTDRKAETLSRGWREMPLWVFCTTRGTMLNKGNVRRVFVRVLKRAELPLHFLPHCLRPTFASLLLQQGESPVYVQGRRRRKAASRSRAGLATGLATARTRAVPSRRSWRIGRDGVAWRSLYETCWRYRNTIT